MKTLRFFLSTTLLAVSLSGCGTNSAKDKACDSYEVAGIKIGSSSKSIVEVTRYQVSNVAIGDVSFSEEVLIDKEPPQDIRILNSNLSPSQIKALRSDLSKVEKVRNLIEEDSSMELDWLTSPSGTYIVYEENDVFSGIAKIVCESTGNETSIDFELYGGSLVEGILECGIKPRPGSVGERMTDYCESV